MISPLDHSLPRHSMSLSSDKKISDTSWMLIPRIQIQIQTKVGSESDSPNKLRLIEKIVLGFKSKA